VTRKGGVREFQKGPEKGASPILSFMLLEEKRKKKREVGGKRNWPLSPRPEGKKKGSPLLTG